MPQQDTSQIKSRIISLIRLRGPSLPVHIAREVGLSILFAGAFLSELVSDKTLKITDMKVGGSPVYYMPGQEGYLDRFSMHLKSKEKDAFELLKEKKFLLDADQEPAIRVALRSIRDFAVPFKRDEEIYWRYHTVPESDLEIKEERSAQKSFEPEKTFEEKADTLDVLDTKPKETKSPKKIKETKSKKSKGAKPYGSKKDEKFFNKVKEYIAKKGMEISDIEGFNKSELVLRVKDSSKEYLLIAYNKKRLTEQDLIKAHKKSQDYNLGYLIFSLGDLPKKTLNLIEALRDLVGMEKI